MMKTHLLTITQHWVWMIPLLLVIAGLGTRQIARFPISVDELLSMNNAGYINDNPTPDAILDNLQTYSAQHVPAYFLILGTVSQVLGWTPPALRLMSVWFGLLALAGVYRLGREHFSGAVGLYASLFIAGLTLYSFYYAHIRMYTLLVMATTFLLWSYLRVIHTQRPVTKLEWVSLSLSTLLFLSSHIFSITLMAVIGLYHLLVVSRNRRWWQVTGAMIIGGLPLIPWLPVLLAGFRHTSTFSIVTNNALTPIEIIQDMLIVYSNSVIPFLLIWLAIAMYLSLRQQPKLRLWLSLSMGTACVIVLIGAITPIIPPDRMRYTFVLLVPLAIAFGVTVAHFRYHILIAGVVIAIWFGADLWMHRQHDMSRYLGGRMNIYDMPRIDEYSPLIQSATTDETLILDFSNHHDLLLAVRHGNTIQDFYYDRIDRSHYSLFIPQAELKDDATLETDLRSALVGWEQIAILTQERHIPPKRIRRLYDAVLEADYQICDTVTLDAKLSLTYYSKEECQ